MSVAVSHLTDYNTIGFIGLVWFIDFLELCKLSQGVNRWVPFNALMVASLLAIVSLSATVVQAVPTERMHRYASAVAAAPCVYTWT